MVRINQKGILLDGNFARKLGQIPDVIIFNAPKVILALAIFFIGKYVLAKIMGGVEVAALKIPNIGKTLSSFFVSTIHFAGLALIIIAALFALNIPLGFLATMLTALVPDAPWAKVSNLGDSSVDIEIRVWCKSDDYWDVMFDLTKSIKEAFEEGNISIPYPHNVEIAK